MSLVSSARSAINRFGHLGKPGLKSTPANAADDKDKKDAKAEDDKDKEKASDDDKEKSDDDDKEKASDEDDDDKEDDDKEEASDDDKEEASDDDKDEKSKKAFRAGQKAEGSRWSTVMAHKSAANNPAFACQTLSSTRLSAKAIIGMLGTMPTAEASKPGLGQRMSNVPIPKVGPDAGAAADPKTAEGLAAQITANYNRARGVKPAAA